MVSSAMGLNWGYACKKAIPMHPQSLCTMRLGIYSHTQTTVYVSSDIHTHEQKGALAVILIYEKRNPKTTI